MLDMKMVFAARDGDKTAMETLLKVLDPEIQRRSDSALGRKRGNLGESVAQEVRKDLWRGLKGFRGQTEAEFRNWLGRVIRNNVRDVIRGEPEPTSSLDETSEGGGHLRSNVPGTGTTPTQNNRRKERAEQLRKAIGKLNATDREVLTLKYFEGVGNEELATLLRIPKNAVYQRLHRAMENLGKHFDGSI